MIRDALVSIWIISLTLASAYFGATVGFRSTAQSSSQGEGGPALINMKSLTVPVIANGGVQGYVIARITLSVKRDLLKTLPQPPDLVLTDSVFKTIYAEEQVDFKHLVKQDLNNLSNTIRDNANAIAGVPLVENAFIQELHYLSRQEAAAGFGVGAGVNAGLPHR